MATKAAREASKQADLAMARMKRAEIDNKIAKEENGQRGLSKSDPKWHKHQAEIKKLQAEKLSYSVRS